MNLLVVPFVSRWHAPGLRANVELDSIEALPPGCFDYLLLESTGISEPLPLAASRLGRRTVRTLPLLPPPQ